MEQNYVGYGYTPIYHTLQGQPDQFHQFSNVGSEAPAISNEIQHQAITSTPSGLSNEFSDLMVIKKEENAEKFQISPSPVQRTQFLPSIFNHHPYHQPPMPAMPWENNFNYHQYHQYTPINYQSPPFDPRFIPQSSIQYSAPSIVHAYPNGYQQPALPPFKQPNSPTITTCTTQIIQQQPQGFFNPPTTTLPTQQTFKTISSSHCSICDKNFTTSTHYKRHLQTKSHLSRLPANNVDHAEPMVIKTGNRSFQITFAQQNNPITDLSEAEIVMIDKIDKELSSIEPSMLNCEDLEDEKKLIILSNSSPLPIVSSSSSSASTSSVENGEFNCESCHKNFSKKCYLTQHNKTAHVGSKPFKCIKCGKKYDTSETLENHMTKHGDNKPFKCTQCPKAFIHKTDLKRHVILHTSEKPHTCEQCGKGFIRKDHLNKHIVSHKKKIERMQKIYTAAMT